MTDSDAGRDFKGLDARAAQEALAEELSGEESEEVKSVNDQSENGETQEVEDGNAPTDQPQEQCAEAGVDGGDEAGEEDNAAAPAPEPVVEWGEEDLVDHTRMLEALLFAAAEPLDLKTLSDRLPVGAAIPLLIDRLQAAYKGRGVELGAVDGKWRFTTAPDVAPILQKEKTTQRKLSRAALETLAIIAYHQPCTRADIEDVRGVQVAKGSLDQLLEIGWVRLRGKRRDVPGRPTLYGTSQGFLEHFGLENISDLPGLADLKGAGLLDARLPPGFSVPSPVDGDDDDFEGEDEEGADFAQDFLDEEGNEAADA